MAAADFFLKIDGIEGESQDKTHKGEIPLLSWSFGAAQSGTSSHGSGAGGGKVNFQDFHFVMTVNKSTPKLLEKCSDGTHIKSAILVCRKAGGTQQEYLKVTFTDILVSSYQIGGSGGSDLVPTDQISLNFSKIEFEYKEQKADGSLGGAIKTGYDQKLNQKV
jgi:type VI secretion system secreted protein Hcp